MTSIINNSAQSGQMNSSGEAGGDGTAIFLTVLFFITVCGSALFCLVAAILVCVLRLYKSVVYRLALYQVLTSLAFTIVEALQSTLINERTPRELCTVVAWLTLYTPWVKLLFTAWTTLHIFCFGVFHKTLRLELCYVASSLLVPAGVASVPLITGSYGRMFFSGGGSKAICYIFEQNETNAYTADIERLALWDGPAMVILFAASAAMVVMVMKLARRVCWRYKYDALTEGDQFWKALKQLLPLAAFPILFFIFIIPQLVLNIFLATTPNADKSLFLAALVFITLWSLASGVTLIVHIYVAKCYMKKRREYPDDISLNTQRSTYAIEF